MSWSESHFDPHAFAGRRPHVVSATYSPEGWTSSGISFNDYSKMHIQRRGRTQERRLPTPAWAVRDEWLQLLLVTYLEERFYCKAMPELDLVVRLELARQAAVYYAPRKRQLLKDWLEDYYTISHGKFDEMADDDVLTAFLSLREIHGQMPIDVGIAREYMTGKKLRDLEIQIQNLDTDLVLTEKGHAEIIVAIVYLYYRLGWDSVTCAEQLGLKSPHIRQVLARLHTTWRQRLSHLEQDDQTAPGGQEPAGNPLRGDASKGAIPPAAPFDSIFEGVE